MSNEEMINELKKDLVYSQYRDTYVIRGENLPFMAERLVKLFTIPDVSKSLKCDCKHSGSCRYEEVILETKELCRHKE